MAGEQMTPVDLGVSDEDLFNAAEADEAADSPSAAAAEVEQQPEAKPNAADEVVAEHLDSKADQAGDTKGDDNAAMVPSWRLREINEQRRAERAELEKLRAEQARWQAQQQQVRREEQKPAEKAAKPDPLLDPEGYAKAVRDELRQEMIADRREESLQRAREANPKDFDEAYTAAQKAIDPALAARMQASRDPGKTLLEWHRENKTRQEIGGDLKAYQKRIRDEALKDPEFRKTAIAAWQADAQPLTNGRPNVELPPSLSSASRSALSGSVDNDISDEGLWQHANA